MNFKALKGLLVAALVALVMPAVAQEQNPMEQPLPIDPEVRHGVLDNGLTYYIRYNNTPKNRVEFHIAQKVGSVLEEEQQRGLAHFLEHMAFNGTTNFPGKNMLNYLEQNGIKFGIDINAYTSLDETVYRVSNVPSTNPGLVDSCLLVLHDWSCGILLQEAEIDNERGVIHEEWRTRNDAQWRIFEKVLPVMFEGSQYANRLPIGTMEVVMNFPYQDIRDYYHKWYRPDNQAIIVIGDIDVDKMEARVKELFGGIKMPENPAERIYFEVPDNKEPIYVVGSDVEGTNTSIDVYFKHDPLPREYRGTLVGVMQNYINSVASMMLGNRYREISSKPNSPYIFAYGYDSKYFGIAATKDAFTLSATVEEGKVIEGLKGLVREAERAERFGFTASEYARAQAEVISSYENMFNERKNRRNIEYANEYIRHYIDGGYIPGIETEFQLIQALAPQIPLEVINQYIAEAITDENIVICVTGPEKEGIVYPTAEEAIAAIHSVQAEEMEGYVDEVIDEPLISHELTPGRVIAEYDNVTEGATTWLLSNGTKVVYKKTDFKDDEIYMKAVSKGGMSLYGEEDAINLKAFPLLHSVGGLGKFSETNLQKALAGKNAGASLSLNIGSEAVTAYSTVKDFETMLQLVYLTFTDIRKDQEVYDVTKEQYYTILKSNASNPKSIFSKELSKTLYANNPFLTSVEADDLLAADYDRILAIAKERTANAADYTFFFVGSLDLETFQPLVEKYIGSLPSNNTFESYDAKNIYAKGEVINRFELPMENPAASVYVIYNGTTQYSVRKEIMMDMLSQIMDIVYTETIREQEGGTYGVGTTSGLSNLNDEWMFLFGFDTNVEKQAHLTNRAKEELAKVIEKGAREEDFNKVKEYLLKEYDNDIRENSYWLTVLTEQLYGTYLDQEYKAALESITLSEFNSFIRETLSGNENIVEVIMTAKAE